MKKMKWLPMAAAMLAVGFASCTNEELEDTNLSSGKTAIFAAYQPGSEEADGVVKNSRVGLKTTMGTYGVFQWTKGDRIWVERTKGDWVRSTNAVKETLPKEIFTMDGEYTAEKYPVVYTGNGDNTAWNTVTIKNEQHQELPNDGTHLGTDGDVGTSTTSTRQATGYYHFSLIHRAHYLEIVPSHTFTGSELKLKRIVLSAIGDTDIPLCGTYTWTATSQITNGIHRATNKNTAKTISLTVGDNFVIPAMEDVKLNNDLWDDVRAFMVLSTGVHTLQFTYIYTVDGVERQTDKFVTMRDYKHGTYTTVRHILSDDYGLLGGHANTKFDANVNDIHDSGFERLNMPSTFFTEDDMKWYQWDAPVDQYETAGVPFPEGTADRFHIPEFPGQASQSWKDLPNANELYWWFENGDARWDDTMLWSQDGGQTEQMGGLWLKKKKTILAEGKTFRSDIGLDGLDMRTALVQGETEKNSVYGSPMIYQNIPIEHGRPADVSKYFFLPAMGNMHNKGDIVHVGNNGWAAVEIPSSTVCWHEFTNKETGVKLESTGYFVLRIGLREKALFYTNLYATDAGGRRNLAYNIWPKSWFE